MKVVLPLTNLNKVKSISLSFPAIDFIFTGNLQDASILWRSLILGFVLSHEYS